MSLESISLIGILTCLTIVVGIELFLLLIGRAVFEANDFGILDTIVQGSSGVLWRMLLLLLLLLVAATVLNLIDTTRTEKYLLRIGLGSLLVYLTLFFFSLFPAGVGDASLAENRITTAVNPNAQSIFSLWYEAWTLLLWPRAITALVSFWSFLHYAMNPKL